MAGARSASATCNATSVPLSAAGPVQDYSGVRLIRRTNQPLPCPAAGSDFTHDAVAQRLGMAAGADTLLRLVRRSAPGGDHPCAVRVLGVDDRAWRRGQRY